MRKLELKDIAAYLPYKPKCHVMGGYDDDGNTIEYTATGSCIDCVDKWVYVNSNDDESYVALEDIFLLLHPMSDLTKEITVEGYNEGKAFVPSKEINLRWHGGEFGIVEDVADEGEYPKIAIMPTDYMDYIDSFNQWHFDYRGLIEQGLAIDINTLNK